MSLAEKYKTEREPSPYKFNQEILREYDIRGQIDINLSEDDAYALGCAFGSYVKKKGGQKVVVGYDGRHSSPGLASSLIAGLVAIGLDVENIGIGPTPMLYFALKDRMKDAGIMITGSHNPVDYNGFKMTLRNEQVFGETIQELGRISEKGEYTQEQGSVREIDVRDTYLERLLRDLTSADFSNLNIAWDCGNGAAGEIVRRLVDRLPGTHHLLYDEIDGDFPNHHPDPTVDVNLIDLQKTMAEQGCDLGIAFDGDGDRIGVVNEKGEILRSDILVGIYAKEILEDRPGAPVIADVKCSQVLFDEIKRLGGTPIMWKTGHSLLKDKMSETKAPLGGELSGHICFADKWYGFDDGIYCAIRLINEIAESGQPLSEHTAHLPQTFNTPEIRFDVDEARKFEIVDQMAEKLKETAASEPDVEVIDMDGIRYVTPDGWWLLRASNTQNVLGVRAESQSAEGLEKMKQMLIDEVKAFGYDLDFNAQH